jgi:tryptophan synthase alpha chain
MADRYATMFARLAARGERALIPFITLGDPDLGASARTITDLVEAGADALELGIPFSDPVADGPVLQAASTRALANGLRLADCLAWLGRVRRAHPDIPIGLLVYANTVVHGGIDGFYARAAAAGVDSVLIADVPLLEGAPFERAAAQAGIAQVFVAPPNASAATLLHLAGRGQGYTYVTSRRGVTGTHDSRGESLALRIDQLRALGAPPPVVGFGIGTPEDVRAACEAGAAGVIVGSALVARLAAGEEVSSYVRALKAPTRLGTGARLQVAPQ